MSFNYRDAVVPSNGMSGKIQYSEKFERISRDTLFAVLQPQTREFVRRTAFRYGFTLQELRLAAEGARDLEMWGGEDAETIWARLEQGAAPAPPAGGRSRKKALLNGFQRRLEDERQKLRKYPSGGFPRPAARALRTKTEYSERKIAGACPVCSDKTICCGLQTIDAVQNCGFACSYCTIQTFYKDEVIFDGQLGEKLRALQLDPGRFYHFGSGQSSDSLLWGNACGQLDELCSFAAAHPNILLELKTKSDNVDFLLKGKTPDNVVCSWSLNTDTVIGSEEHFTASLGARLSAARLVADRGVKVAFHFHPVLKYAGWEQEYRDAVEEMMSLFSPAEVLFISLGSLTFIKPVLQAIRRRGGLTKVLQMKMVEDPHGKMTSSDEEKVEMFSLLYAALRPWHDSVYIYLCMEKADIWQRVLGWCYPDNQAFLEDSGKRTMARLKRERAREGSTICDDLKQ